MLIISPWLVDHLNKTRVLGSLLVWSIQVCITTVQRGKDINNGPREVVVATYQSGKCYINTYK